MTKYEITNQEYADFLNVYGSDEVKSGQYKGEKMIYEGSWGVKKQNNKWQPVEGYAKHPVVNVTWFGANEYARYQGGRLPTEAEWEYACRAGTTTPFNTGSNLTTAQGNYDGNYPYNNNPKGEYRGKTLPVGSFEPNAWGLYDMHGNVSEWCEDWYDSNFYTTAEAKKTNPLNIKQGEYRSLRGGSWFFNGRYCRSAYRSYGTPSYYNFTYGFRVVFEL
jgi:formylglycine-generating enzyme required for sulfatase activity